MGASGNEYFKIISFASAVSRVSPRRARHFSLLRQRKVPKRNATPRLRPLRFATGQTCTVSLARCAAQLTSRWRAAFGQTRRVSQQGMRAPTRMLTAQANRRRRSQQGVDSRTSKHPLGPSLRSARQHLRPARGACAREEGPSAAMARVVCGCSTPCWLRLRRGACGVACAPPRTCFVN